MVSEVGSFDSETYSFMFLHSGKVTRMTEITNLTEMVKAMMEERMRHDEELAEERRERDRQLVEERNAREEQMRAFIHLVEGVTRPSNGREGGTTGNCDMGRDAKKAPKITKLSDDDDIEAYLTTFERLMTAHEIPRRRWSFELAPALTGRAQQAYAALEEAQANDYDQLKEEVLKRYDINEESYRQRFQTTRKGSQESYRELNIRMLEKEERTGLSYYPIFFSHIVRSHKPQQGFPLLNCSTAVKFVVH